MYLPNSVCHASLCACTSVWHTHSLCENAQVCMFCMYSVCVCVSVCVCASVCESVCGAHTVCVLAKKYGQVKLLAS